MQIELSVLRDTHTARVTHGHSANFRVQDQFPEPTKNASSFHRKFRGRYAASLWSFPDLPQLNPWKPRHQPLQSDIRLASQGVGSQY